MFMRSFLALLLLTSLTAGCGRAGEPPAAPASAPSARISLEAARDTALARVPGKVLKEELEREDGRDIYSFDIQPDGEGSGLKEIHVDANDGTILAVEDEEPTDKQSDD